MGNDVINQNVFEGNPEEGARGTYEDGPNVHEDEEDEVNMSLHWKEKDEEVVWD